MYVILSENMVQLLTFRRKQIVRLSCSACFHPTCRNPQCHV